jgi:uncharacterized protein (TIGR02172 family)
MKLIAKGRTAEVYTWETGKVLKLFNPGASRGTAEYEQRLAQTAHTAGMRSPAVFEIVQIEGRFGIVYESVAGETMLQRLRSKPWQVLKLGKLMAELQAGMHACTTQDLPSMRERLVKRISAARPLPEGLRQSVLSDLLNLPEDNRICHGDFHPENILMTEHEPVIIDWIDATAGNPLGDIARTTLIIRYSVIPPETPKAWLIRLLRNLFYRAYIQRYVDLTHCPVEDVHYWLGVVAAARLAEGISEEEANLLRLAQAGSTFSQPSL